MTFGFLELKEKSLNRLASMGCGETLDTEAETAHCNFGDVHRQSSVLGPVQSPAFTDTQHSVWLCLGYEKAQILSP